MERKFEVPSVKKKIVLREIGYEQMSGMAVGVTFLNKNLVRPKRPSTSPLLPYKIHNKILLV
jgi:hypothetical protein